MDCDLVVHGSLSERKALTQIAKVKRELLSVVDWIYKILIEICGLDVSTEQFYSKLYIDYENIVIHFIKNYQQI